MNVLLADASSTIQSILKRQLERERDCTVAEAENGLEVLKAIDRERFSFVLIDVHMPVMDGLEALEMLRNSVHSAVPVVMLTSDRDQALFKRAVALGITDYLTKPLRLDTLAERLGSVLGSLDTAAQNPGIFSSAYNTILLQSYCPARLGRETVCGVQRPSA